MRALCVGRHRFLSEHLADYFRGIGLDAVPVVGLDAAADVVRRDRPDLVIGDYDLLATQPLATWEESPELATMPVVAVSLTRRPDEVHPMDVNGIAGFLYLPTLAPDDALRAIRGASPRVRYSLPSPFKLTAPLPAST